MARGSIAKENVENIIKQAFGEDFVTVQDKKLYVWANDGGERVQISISLTCPKTFVGEESGKLEFAADANPVEASDFTPAAITKEETETLEALMKKFGLV